MSRTAKRCVMVQLGLLGLAQKVFADDPVTVMNDFSQKSISILQGPVVKILGAVVLLAGAASLLRGRHKLAIACGIAFVVLLFLPGLLTKVGNGQ